MDDRSRDPSNVLGPNHISGTAEATVVKFCVYVYATSSPSLDVINKYKRLSYRKPIACQRLSSTATEKSSD